MGKLHSLLIVYVWDFQNLSSTCYVKQGTACGRNTFRKKGNVGMLAL